MTGPAFLEALQQYRQLTRSRGGPVPLSQFVGPDVTAEQVERRRKALNVIEALGPGFDYGLLDTALAKAKGPIPEALGLPPGEATPALLSEVISLGKQMEASRRSVAGQVVGFGGAIPARVLEGLTFGLLRPDSQDQLLGDKGKLVANLVGDLISMGMLGIGTYKAVGRFTELPRVAPLIEKLPQRVRAVMMGGTAMGVAEASRPEGLPEEPMAIDVPARIAKFAEPVTGARLGLAVGGAVVGAGLDMVLSPLFHGLSTMRETHLINKGVPDAAVGDIRKMLEVSGIPTGTSETKAQLVRKLLANQGKVRQTLATADALAGNNARAQYVAQFIYEHPDKVWFRPKMPETKVIGTDGQPLRVFHGSPAAPSGPLVPREKAQEDLFGALGLFFSDNPAVANSFAGAPATAGAVARTTRAGLKAPNITAAYLDLRNPLDVTLPFDDKLAEAVSLEVQKLLGPGTSRAQVFDRLKRYRSIEGYLSESGGTEASQLVAQAAKAQGYDGIIYPAHLEGLVDASLEEAEGRVFIAFKGDAVKPAWTIKEDPVYLASLFINNPTGVSVAKGVLDPEAVTDAGRILGVRMAAVRAGDKVLITRPTYALPDIELPPSLVQKFKDTVKAENRGFRAEPVMQILPDGSRAVGKIDMEDFATKIRLAVKGLPADKAVRERLALISAELQGDGGELLVNLPSRVTNQQMAELARFVDNSSVRRVTILSPSGGPAVVVDNPIGMQVQDQIAQVLKLPEPKVSDVLAKKMAQFAKSGVFEGQAAVNENGYVLEVLGRTKSGTLKLRDPFTKEVFESAEDRVGLLPTSVEGIHTPNSLILDKMTDAEKMLHARALKAVSMGFTQPVKSSRQLERLAAARGLFVDKLSAGGYRLVDPVSGEANLYADLTSAVRGVREMGGPLPDLTPPEMQAILGDVNVGLIGPPGPPARFGERMPLPDTFDIPETFGRVPGTIRKALTPTRGLLLDLERIYNVPVGRSFLALQEQIVHRDNFLASWVDAQLPGLPKGVKSLKEIMATAGKGADQELITAWLEADDAARPAIVARMTNREVQAAQELRDWYDALFSRFQVEREYLTEYAPHIRRWMDRYGNDVAELWRRTKGTPLPKGVDFIADYVRDGSLDLYETRAFVAAGQYVHMGANNRFMKPVLEEVRNVLWRIPDNAVKGPLVNYLEAIRGVEYASENAALKASVDNMLESLGMTPTKTAGFTDRLSLTLLGLSYNATMSFRPGLAIRNMTQMMQTTWTMFGGTDDSFMQAIGRAMTLAGRDEAIEAGAISMRTGGVYAAEELAQAMPEPLRVLSEAGMKMYNGADYFNRTVSYFTSKIRAERAIAAYSEATAKGGANLQRARETLMNEAGLFWFDKPVQDEFFRRLIQSPEKAAQWIGKNAADVTQYLYGRGNQVWWLRTVPGRFLGQYGTWPLWYMDFVRRTFMNAWRSGHQGQALRFLGRLGIANGAVVAAGAAVGIDLGKWAGFSSLFFTGGPGAEALGGIASLQRGIGESLFDPDDPFAQSRLTEGSRILERVGRAYIPLWYAARDLDRLTNPRNAHDAATALLAANPSQRYSIQQQLDLLTNLGRLSTDIEIENQHPGELTAVEQMERARRLQEGASEDLRRFFQPQPAQPGTPGGTSAQPPLQGRRPAPIPAPGEVRPQIR